MWKGLFDGITVPPSVGRRRKTNLPIPVVAGTDINRKTLVRDTGIVIDSELILVGSSNGPPFTIDISEYLRIRNAEPPYSINMISYREDTFSAFKRPQTEDDPVVQMNEHGIITYNPKGTYLRNRLEIGIQIADINNPFTLRGIELNQPYAAPEDMQGLVMIDDSTDEEGATPLRPIGEDADEDGNIVVQMQSELIGEVDASGQFWARQGNYDGTCVIASAAAILNSLGHTLPNGERPTLDSLSEYVQQEVDLTNLPVEEQRYIVSQILHGQISVEDSGGIVGDRPPIIDPNGNVMYFKITYLDENGVEQVRTDINFSSDTNGSWSNSTVIFDYLDVDHHTGYAADFSTAIRELEAGNKLLISVDGIELWAENGRVIQEAQDLVDFTIGSETKQNHAVWLTGIEPDENGVLQVILNDSVDTQSASRYPLDVFLSAWEDAEFAYESVGSNFAPDAGLQRQYNSLQKDIDSTFAHLIGPGSDLPQQFRSEYVNLKPQTLATEWAHLVPFAEEAHPGFTNRLNNYLEGLNNQRNEILTRYGIDPDDVKKITEEVDTE